MRKRFGVAIVGGSGYGAGELLRLLHLHPEIAVSSVSSRSHVGKPVSSIHSHLNSLCELLFEAAPNMASLKTYEKSAIVLTMPSGLAASTMADLLAQGIPENTTVVDLSGDFRLKTREAHEKFYSEAPFAEDIRSRFRYGLPEISRNYATNADFITNPGCLATAAILALAPLATFELDHTIVVDAKTGTSGAGREPQASMHHPSRCHDFTAYKTLSHRHEPEIVQALGEAFSRHHSLMFVPHLLPTSRGCFVSAYATLKKPISDAALSETFRAFYKTSSFIRLRHSPPRLVDVVGTNFCDLSVVVRDRQIVVMSALDNLGKGMAGQAIQNMNIAFGIPAESGLLFSSLGPV